MKQLWYFSAPWCGPCQQFGSVKKVNIDYEPNASTTYGIKSVPTVILVEDGQEKARFVGARSLNDVLKFYNQ
jgi:thioredoxin-like negative regulator of GroEL